MGWKRDAWHRFRHDIPQLALTWLVVWIGLFALGVWQGEEIRDPLQFALAGAVLGFALSPVIWIRWERPRIGGRNWRRRLAAIGVTVAWAFGVLLLGLGAMDAAGID